MGSVNDTGGVDILASSTCRVLMIVSSEVFAQSADVFAQSADVCNTSSIRIGHDMVNAGDPIQLAALMVQMQITSGLFLHVDDVVMIVSNEVFAQS